MPGITPRLVGMAGPTRRDAPLLVNSTLSGLYQALLRQALRYCQAKLNVMLIESFAPNPDAIETHSIEIAASCETVYKVLWTADMGGSPLIKGLLALRSLPYLVLHPGRLRRRNRKITLQTIIESGFGQLAEEPGREIVLGVAGRFWQPIGNILPFSRENFLGEVPPGFARAVWNFAVREADAGRTILSTETRVVCGDSASRRKFRAYWFVVRPFSGLIRLIMLRAVRRACKGAP